MKTFLELATLHSNAHFGSARLLGLAPLLASSLIGFALPALGQTPFQVLRSFDYARDGGNPLAGLAAGADGALYGTTWFGGSAEYGTAFRLGLDGTDFSVLQNFDAATTGGVLFAGLTVGPDGTLYGVANNGVGDGAGTVFRMNPDGSDFRILHQFDTASTGNGPIARLKLGQDGVLYGATTGGGEGLAGGTVFKLNTDGTDFSLVQLLSNFENGFDCRGVIQAADGVLYGTTLWGGSFAQGTVFKVSPDGTGFTVLHHLEASTTGAYPEAGLVEAADGRLYGVTSWGGMFGGGTLFTLKTDGADFSVLHDFGVSGAVPVAELVQGPDGALYGTTSLGGSGGGGEVFKLQPAGAEFTVLHSFDSGPTALQGSNPYGELLFASDGNLYGTTAFGGQANAGTVFRLIFNSCATDTTPPAITCAPDLIIVSDRAACGDNDHDDEDWDHHRRDGRQRDDHEDHSQCQSHHGQDDHDGHGYTCRFWNRCVATGVTLTPPTVTDNCTVASITHDHPSTTYPLGETRVTWTTTDAAGNTSTCVQKVTVVPAVEVSFRSPLARKPTKNTIRRGQVVPFKVELENCLDQTVRSGVTVKLQVQGIDSTTGDVFQDVIEDANGLGSDGTVTSDGLMQYRNSQWQFNLDTGNFGDPNTVAGSRYYRATVTVLDNATLAVLGVGTVNLETSRR